MPCNLRCEAEKAAITMWFLMENMGINIGRIIDRPFTTLPEFPLLNAQKHSIYNFVVILADADLIDFLEFMTYEVGHADGYREGNEVGLEAGYKAAEEEKGGEE